MISIVSTRPSRRFPLHTITELALIAVRAADEKKGTDPVVLDVGDLLSITDYFVIVSASNTRLVMSIAEAVEDELKGEAAIAPLSVEGVGQANWVLLDYGSFVVHVFLEETRKFYDLERLWGDAPRVPYAEVSVGARRT